MKALRDNHFENFIGENDSSDDLCETLNNTVIQILDIMAPLRTSTFSKTRPEWLTAEIIEMMKDRDQALKRAKRSGELEHMKIACKLRNKTNNTIRSAKNDFILHKLETYNKDPKKMCETIQDILPKTKTSTIILHDSYGFPVNDQQMSEEINDFFANVGANLANRIPALGIDDPPPLENLLVPTLMLDDITLEDVKKASKRICVYKSSGMRLITSKIWKILFTEFADVFTKLYNIINKTGKYPKKWKIATVVPIP